MWNIISLFRQLTISLETINVFCYSTQIRYINLYVCVLSAGLNKVAVDVGILVHR